MSVINTNYLALVSQNNLTKSQNALGSAIERLSSGLRINSAKDDAAGQAIANRFTANIKGLTQAARNANDGISIAQTTEGSLNEINNNLQRIRELSVQAANGSNSDTDLASIQAEIRERLDEIDRVSAETQFNGKYVLGDDAASLSVQVGAHDSQRIEINLSRIDSTTLGLSSLDMTSQYTSKELTAVTGNLTEATDAVTVELSFPPGAGELTIVVGDDGELYAQDGADLYAATYDPDAGTISYDSSGTAATGVNATTATTFVDGDGNLVELSTAQNAAHDNADTGGTYQVFQNDTTGALTVWDGTNHWDVNGTDASIDFTTGQVTLATTPSGTTDPSTGATEVTSGNVLTLNGSAAVTVDLATVDAALDEGTNTLMQAKDGSYLVRNTDGDNVTYYAATVNMANGEVTLGEEVTVDPLAAIDDALQQVDNLRSHLGAIQNRFESTIANLNNTVNNLSAARSRIEDTDYAVEVSNMTRAQILQQAGTSVLAQANQVPQTVLSLLR